MKKFVVGLIAALMVAAGLVAVSGASASAKACPYGGCLPTYTFIDAPAKVARHHKATICVRVGSQGNGHPKGKVTVKVVRSNGGFKFVDTKRYSGGRECFTTPKLHKRGDYNVNAIFDRKPGSRWQDSDQHAEFRVVRNH